MAQKRSKNVEKLLAEGFRIKEPLPDEYQQVVDGLTNQEVDLLISLKSRLDAAEMATQPEVGSYSEYFIHPPF
jgi:hypothetical protein